MMAPWLHVGVFETYVQSVILLYALLVDVIDKCLLF